MRCFGTAFIAGSMITASALAQTPVASELYDKGLAEMNERRFETGCPMLAESVRLDRRPGSLFTLAECQARWGKTATAVAHFDDYLAWYGRMSTSDQTAQRDRYDLARARKAELEPKVPKLLLELPPDAPADTVVELDRTRLDRPAIGVGLPVDPGAHRVVVKTGGKERERRFEIAESASLTIKLELPELERSAPRPAPVVRADEKKAETPPKSSDSRKTWMLGAFGLGGAGLVVGSVAGVLAWREKSAVEDGCRDHECNADGKQAADRLQRNALISNIGFGVGVAAIGVGVVLWSTEPKRDDRASRLRVRASVGAAGRPFARVDVAW